MEDGGGRDFEVEAAMWGGAKMLDGAHFLHNADEEGYRGGGA